jgi:hypothetical protein
MSVALLTHKKAKGVKRGHVWQWSLPDLSWGQGSRKDRGWRGGRAAPVLPGRSGLQTQSDSTTAQSPVVGRRSSPNKETMKHPQSHMRQST